MTRSISFFRPITGSSSFFFAKSVRSRPNARKAGVFTSFFPPLAVPAVSSASPSGGVKFGLSSFKIFLQNVHRYALAKLDQAEQKMLGADVIVIEAICFFTRKLQDLLRARGKVIHFSPARNYPLHPAPAPLY